MFDNDLNLFYVGGSGGFFLFHNILLGGKHNAVIVNQDILADYKAKNNISSVELWSDDYNNFKGCDWPTFEEYSNNKINKTKKNIRNEIYALEKKLGSNGYKLKGYMEHVINYITKEQWQVKGILWKSKEFIPNNILTERTKFNSVSNYKIFLTCNHIDQWLNLPGKKIVLYTDINSALRLAWYKKARWFYNGNRNFSSFRKITVQELKNSTNYRNIKIDKVTELALRYADDSIYLQHILLYPEKYNFISEKHKTLHLSWLNNHPDKLLSKCHIVHRT